MRTPRLGAIVAGENAEVVACTFEEGHDAVHRRLAHLDMEIAKLKDGETVERLRQARRYDEVLAQLDLCRVAEAPPIEASRHQNRADHGVGQGEILDVEEVDALPEDLRLVILLDAEARPRMAPTKALFQNRKVGVDVLHFGTSST